MLQYKGWSRSGNNRKEEVILARLQIGHSNLNSTLYIVGKHSSGLSEHYRELETAEHASSVCVFCVFGMWAV